MTDHRPANLRPNNRRWERLKGFRTMSTEVCSDVTPNKPVQEPYGGPMPDDDSPSRAITHPKNGTHRYQYHYAGLPAGMDADKKSNNHDVSSPVSKSNRLSNSYHQIARQCSDGDNYIADRTSLLLPSADHVYCDKNSLDPVSRGHSSPAHTATTSTDTSPDEISPAPLFSSDHGNLGHSASASVIGGYVSVANKDRYSADFYLFDKETDL